MKIKEIEYELTYFLIPLTLSFIQIFNIIFDLSKKAACTH